MQSFEKIKCHYTSSGLTDIKVSTLSKTYYMNIGFPDAVVIVDDSSGKYSES